MADQLAAALEVDGITQAEFARRTGVSPKHINQVLSGKATARHAQLDYWAFVLGREWHIELSDGDDNQETSEPCDCDEFPWHGCPVHGVLADHADQTGREQNPDG